MLNKGISISNDNRIYINIIEILILFHKIFYLMFGENLMKYLFSINNTVNNYGYVIGYE